MSRVVVLLSGNGSNLQALLDADDLGGDIVHVVSDRHGAVGLDRARRAGVPGTTVALADHADRATWEGSLTQATAAAEPDLVVLAGFQRVLSAAFVLRWPVLNVHPSLLPAFPGHRAVADTLAWGAKVGGCTVHFVDEQVDHGPIVAQEAVAVADDDTPESLHNRIKAVEHRLLPHCVRLFAQGRLHVDGRIVRVSP